MKRLPVLLLLILASCGRKQMNKDDLPGSYVRAFQSEYAVGTDTLQLSKTSDNTYRMRKSSAYHRIKDGVLQEDIEHHEEHWLGTFDKAHAVIQALPSGKVLSVDWKKQEILLGNAVYKRVEDN